MTEAPRTVAVYGGSFNPPHIAHQLACLFTLETQPVDQVWMIPTYRHPLDKGPQLIDYEHRVAMCRLAAAPLGDRVQVSEVERELGGESSRTLDTIQELVRRHPGVAFRIVVGADILEQVDQWYRWDDVIALAPPIVLGRPGYAGGLQPQLPEVSSTDVRARLSRGETAVPLVSRAVMDYIASRSLYR